MKDIYSISSWENGTKSWIATDDCIIICSGTVVSMNGTEASVKFFKNGNELRTWIVNSTGSCYGSNNSYFIKKNDKIEMQINRTSISLNDCFAAGSMIAVVIQ